MDYLEYKCPQVNVKKNKLILYIINCFSGLRPGVPDESDSSNFEIIVWNTSV